MEAIVGTCCTFVDTARNSHCHHYYSFHGDAVVGEVGVACVEGDVMVHAGVDTAYMH